MDEGQQPGPGRSRGSAGDHRVRTRREAARGPRYDRRVSHPDPFAPAGLAADRTGEVWENPVTAERAVVLELPWQNPEGRGVAELTALPGARVMGEHLHPSLHERFSVIEGELTVVRDGRRSVLHAGESAQIEPGVWHDWWNEARGTRSCASSSRPASASCT